MALSTTEKGRQEAALAAYRPCGFFRHLGSGLGDKFPYAKAIMPGRIVSWVEAHRFFTILISILMPVSWFLWGLYDREPPIRIYAQHGFNMPQGRPGEEIIFDFPVARNFEDKCDLTFQRYIVDSTKATRPYGPVQEITSAGIEAREAISPDRLRVPITIPPTLPSGRAILLTESSFKCLYNPSTYVMPIRLSFAWPFEVLPPLATSAPQ
jgi:hypothetical protein